MDNRGVSDGVFMQSEPDNRKKATESGAGVTDECDGIAGVSAVPDR